MHKSVFNRYLVRTPEEEADMFIKKYADFFKTRTNYSIQSRLPGWIGDHLVRLETYQKALEYYNEGLKNNPDDPWYYTRRADLNGRSFHREKAAEDIHTALKLNPYDLTATALQAKLVNLYGEFEQSLLLNYDKSKLRKQPPVFRNEFMNAYNTINNCIGQEAGHPLRNHFKYIREIAWQKNQARQRELIPKRIRVKKQKSYLLSSPSIEVFKHVKPLKPVQLFRKPDNVVGPFYRKTVKVDVEDSDAKLEQIDPKKSIRKVEDLREKRKNSAFEGNVGSSSTLQAGQSIISTISLHNNQDSFSIEIPKLDFYPYQTHLQQKTSNLENYMSNYYLRELFHEKVFLKKMKHAGCMGINPKTKETILSVSKDGLVVLDQAQEVLRTRKPFYYMKYQRSLRQSKKVKDDTNVILERNKIIILNKINNLFSILAKWIRKVELRRMIKTGENLYKLCKFADKKVLPDKEDILYRFYILICDGFLLSNRFTPEMTNQEMLCRVLLALGLPYNRTVSQESLFRKIKGHSMNWANLIFTFEQRVKTCVYLEELIWLYHELARFNIEVKRYTIAKTYASRCVFEARKCEHFKWAINGNLLMTKIFVLQSNKKDAKKYLRSAINTVKDISNKEVEVFLLTCFNVLTDWRFEEDEAMRLFMKRQEKILKLIPSKKRKKEMQKVFEKINCSPPDRRFLIVPGVLKNTDQFDMIEREKEERRIERNRKGTGQRGMESQAMVSLYI